MLSSQAKDCLAVPFLLIYIAHLPEYTGAFLRLPRHYSPVFEYCRRKYLLQSALALRSLKYRCVYGDMEYFVGLH